MHIYLKKVIFILILFILFSTVLAAVPLEVKVGADVDYAPFSFLSKKKPEGFDIQFFNLLSESASLSPDFTLLHWEDVLKKCRTGEIDIVLGAVYTQEREDFLHFTVPYNSITMALIVPENSSIKFLSNLEGKEMASLKNDAVPEVVLNRNNILVNTVYYNTLTEVIRSIAEGKHDFCIVPEPYVDLIKKGNFQNGLHIIRNDTFSLTYRIGLNENTAHLLPQLNAGIKNLLETDAYRKLRQRWLEAGDDEEKTRSLSPLTIALIAGGALIIGGFVVTHIFIRRFYTTSL